MVEYDRSLKARCLKEILSKYGRFANVPANEPDKRLVFFLTMCRILDKAAREIEEKTDATQEDDKPEPWNLTRLQRNYDRFFSRYQFSAQESEQSNFDAFVDRLLNCSADSLYDVV